MKIVLFMPNYIGDVLMTTPAIRFLKKSVPSSELTVVIKPYLLELIETNPNVSNVIFKHSKYQTLKDVVKIKPNYAILFRTTFFNSLVTKLSSVKYSVGLNEEFGRLFLKETIKKDLSRPYRTECAILVERFLEYMNISKKILPNELKKLDFFGYDNEEVKISVEQKLYKFGIDVNKKLIIISPFATRKTKMLTVEQNVKIVNLLNQTFGKNIEIIFVGGKDAIFFVNQIMSIFDNRYCKSLCGELTLKELGYLLSISSYMISVDSGPAYISQAVGTKTIIIFTSTLPEKYGPYDENVKIVYNPTICSPCYKNECKRKDYKCVQQVDLNKIIENISL